MKLKHDKLLSAFAIKCNRGHYMEVLDVQRSQLAIQMSRVQRAFFFNITHGGAVQVHPSLNLLAFYA